MVCVYVYYVYPDCDDAASKARHPALDAGSPEKRALIFSGLRVFASLCPQ
jgi:hypothetical protein